jgi:hypothetical protein
MRRLLRTEISTVMSAIVRHLTRGLLLTCLAFGAIYADGFLALALCVDRDDAVWLMSSLWPQWAIPVVLGLLVIVAARYSSVRSSEKLVCYIVGCALCVAVAAGVLVLCPRLLLALA